MTLDEAVKLAKDSIDVFEEEYKVKHKENPEHYPIELPEDNEGLWFEMISGAVCGDEI